MPNAANSPQHPNANPVTGRRKTLAQLMRESEAHDNALKIQARRELAKSVPPCNKLLVLRNGETIRLYAIWQGQPIQLTSMLQRALGCEIAAGGLASNVWDAVEMVCMSCPQLARWIEVDIQDIQVKQQQVWR
jgi:hypothetical protein